MITIEELEKICNQQIRKDETSEAQLEVIKKTRGAYDQILKDAYTRSGSYCDIHKERHYTKGDFGPAF